MDLDIPTLRARRTNKWQKFPEDVLPAWVADMDFGVAPPIRAALHRLADQEAYGYAAREGALAAAFARRVHAGSVCVNDVVAPTADPRLPFTGRGRSGYGETRGAEGLLRMTVVKTLSQRRGSFRPHLDPPRPDGARLFGAMVAVLHGGLPGWLTAFSLLRKRG